MLFHSCTAYGHVFLILDIFFEELMNEPFSLNLAMNWTCRLLGLLEVIMLLCNSLYYDDEEWII